MIYLYLKTHNLTGLKYLGKTIKDPYEYSGSGIVWTRHLKSHGNDVTTEILFATNNKKLFRKVALEYSEKLNIVESQEFANLTREEGQGGQTWDKKGITPNIDYRKRSEKYRGKTHQRSKTCIIHGVEYGSTREASEKIGIHHTTISYRCRSELNPNYYYI